MLEFFSPENIAALSPAVVYGGLFLICLLEGMPVVGSLVAGGTITFAIGTIASTGVVDPIISMAIAALGSVIGDLLGFFALRFYGERIRVLRKLIKGVRDNEGWLSDVFDRRYFAITVFARLVPFIRSGPSLVAAVRAVPVRGYVVASFLASALWSVTGIAAGYGLSNIFEPRYILMAVVAIAVISALVGIIKHLRKQS